MRIYTVLVKRDSALTFHTVTFLSWNVKLCASRFEWAAYIFIYILEGWGDSSALRDAAATHVS